jgi:hypothetical protein
MTDLRRLKDADPRFATERAREGNRRFPDSADAPERVSILIYTRLAAAGNASGAPREAEDRVDRYADSDWVREVELRSGRSNASPARIGIAMYRSTPNGPWAFD